MSSALKIAGVILAGICLGLVIAGVALYLIVAQIKRDVARAFAPSETAAQAADVRRIHFLQSVDFAQGPVTLVLESSITGADSIVIDDQDRLHAMRHSASIPDLGIGGERRLITAMITGRKIFDRVPAIRIFQNGRLIREEFCLPDICNNDPETRKELAPLEMIASGRVVTHAESYTDHDAYLAAYQRALATPGRLTWLRPVADGKTRWPFSFDIHLPPFEIAAAPPLSDAARTEWQAYERDIEDAIRARIGPGSVIALGQPMPNEMPLRRGCRAGPGIAGFAPDRTIMALTASVTTDATGRDRAMAITDWSFLPLRPPPALPDEIADLIASGRLSPDCLVDSTGQPLLRATAMGPVSQERYRLVWEEAVPMEPADEPAFLE
ncbi:MAG: hypothetical protein Q4G26_10290 [Paracoccus sp. (in: a-proteobacteria)]|nr:hypothetical protein [Paracoccus sp. (in: a-proteobacteria)]